MSHWDDVSKEDFNDETMSFLVDVIGLDAAKKIIEIFGGESIYVPKAESVIRMVRDRSIYKDFKEKGYHYREIAARYNLTTRHVRVIIKAQKRNKHDIKGQQLEMF